jgi:hypothetical protein
MTKPMNPIIRYAELVSASIPLSLRNNGASDGDLIRVALKKAAG